MERGAGGDGQNEEFLLSTFVISCCPHPQTLSVTLLLFLTMVSIVCLLFVSLFASIAGKKENDNSAQRLVSPRIAALQNHFPQSPFLVGCDLSATVNSYDRGTLHVNEGVQQPQAVIEDRRIRCRYHLMSRRHVTHPSSAINMRWHMPGAITTEWFAYITATCPSDNTRVIGIRDLSSPPPPPPRHFDLPPEF